MVGVTSAPPATTPSWAVHEDLPGIVRPLPREPLQAHLAPDVVERLGLPAVVDHQGGTRRESLDRHVDRRERVAGRVVDLEQVDVVEAISLGCEEPGRRAPAMRAWRSGAVGDADLDGPVGEGRQVVQQACFRHV